MRSRVHVNAILKNNDAIQRSAATQLLTFHAAVTAGCAV